MRSPFKFLDSYTKDDRAIFFGRDREIEELYHRVFESKIMLVYGVSGTGKSSLIHCGLANKFQDTDWLPIVIRRGGNIIESMSAGIRLASLTEQQSKFATTADFKKGVRSLYLDHYKPVFFIFDQFEELFIFGDKEERRLFIHIVKTLTESELQCRMIFVMREEYMAGVTEFEKFIPTFFANRVRIEKMSHRNALEAIKEPCKVFNINLEEGFAESLLEKLSPGETDVELTYLQVFLDKIYRLSIQNLLPSGSNGGLDVLGKEGGPSFTLDLLSKTGNVSDLLGSFLDDQISLMEDPETAMSILKAFVSGKGTKRPASEQEAIDNIRSFGKEISPETVKELIQSFVKLRVLRDKDDNGRYELRHDALAEKVYEKFSTVEKELLEIRQFIENSYQSWLKRRILLSNDDLNYISGKDSLLKLNPDLEGFIEESRKHQKAKLKTVRRLTAISAVSFLVLICIPVYYILDTMKRTRADRQAIRSISQVSDPIRRLIRAGEAWEMCPAAMPKEALLKAFNDILQSGEKDSVMKNIEAEYKIEFEPAPVNIQHAECSKDNRYIFGYCDSLIFIWTLHGKLDNTIQTKHYPLIDIKMSEDSRLIGAVSTDSILTVWDILGKEQFTFKTQYNELNTRQVFKFTNRNNIIALIPYHDAVLLNPEGKTIQIIDRHKGIVNAVDISPDNNFIATASSDKTINIWYLNSVKNCYDYYNSLNRQTDTVLSVVFAKNNVFVISAFKTEREFSYLNLFDINNEDINYNYWNDKNNCYGEFTPSGNGIIYTCYSYSNGKLNKYYYGLHYKNPVTNIVPIYSGSPGYESLEFSADDNYYTFTENKNIYLADNRLALEKDRFKIRSTHILLSDKGINPFFTRDADYLMFIDQKMISTYFINIEKIFRKSQELSE